MFFLLYLYSHLLLFFSWILEWYVWRYSGIYRAKKVCGFREFIQTSCSKSCNCLFYCRSSQRYCVHYFAHGYKFLIPNLIYFSVESKKMLKLSKSFLLILFLTFGDIEVKKNWVRQNNHIYLRSDALKRNKWTNQYTN